MANLIDPNIALQVKPYTPPDYSQTLGNALTLKSGIQQSQATDRDIQNQQMLKDLWAKADTTTPEGQADFVKKAAAIDPKAAVAARQNFSKEAETQASIGEKKAAAAQHFATAQKDIEPAESNVKRMLSRRYSTKLTLISSNSITKPRMERCRSRFQKGSART